MGRKRQSIKKSELVLSLSEKFPGLRIEDMKFIVDNILEQMSESLSASQRIEIRGFGSFALHYRPPRIAHNPITREKIVIVGRYYPYFRAGNELRNRVNKKKM